MTDDLISVDEIRRALMGHFPLDQYVHVHEAATTADRSGRKLDVVCFGTWKTRGLERIGIEIKRSIADLRVELNDPEKADWWIEHTHRFFIAAPARIAQRVKLDVLLPVGWGLLSVSDAGRVSMLIPAARRKDPKPLPESAVVGILRSAADTGPSALQRRFDDGVKAGRKQAEAERVGVSPEAYTGELERLRTAHAELRAAVERFHERTGITISTYNPSQSAERLKMALQLLAGVSQVEQFDRPIAEMRAIADRLRRPLDG